jgi:hypothetical protein
MQHGKVWNTSGLFVHPVPVLAVVSMPPASASAAMMAGIFDSFPHFRTSCACATVINRTVSRGSIRFSPHTDLILLRENIAFLISAADLHHFHSLFSDPDPTYHVHADLDPAFHVTNEIFT